MEIGEANGCGCIYSRIGVCRIVESVPGDKFTLGTYSKR